MQQSIARPSETRRKLCQQKFREKMISYQDTIYFPASSTSVERSFWLEVRNTFEKHL